MDAAALLQLAMSFVGALGFALFFNVTPKHVAAASVGGVLTWLIYWLIHQVAGAIFLPCLVASTFAAIYAEAIARACKVPTSVFFIIAVIPLVPGRGLFYTMSNAVHGDWLMCADFAIATLQFAAGIALGICLVTAAVQTASYGRARMRRALHFNHRSTNPDDRR